MRFVFALSACLLVAGAAAAACGGDDGPTARPSTPSGTEPATAAASPTPSDSSATPATPVVVDPAAVQVVLDYYNLINEQKYADAYVLWEDNGAASKQTREQFFNGLG